MRIGELSRRTGITRRALRYYEEQGLLRPLRRPSGYREYAEGDVQTVLRIRVLLAAGLGTAVIAGVLPCLVKACRVPGRCDRVPHCPHVRAVLDGERRRISGAIDELRSALTALDDVIAAPGRLRSPEDRTGPEERAVTPQLRARP